MATDEELKRAYKAFKKRIKLTRLDDESGRAFTLDHPRSFLQPSRIHTGHRSARTLAGSPSEALFFTSSRFFLFFLDNVFPDV